MNRKILPYLGLGLMGLFFLGAEDPLANTRFVTAFRPQPAQNFPGVPAAGYLVVTTAGGEWICDRRDVMSVSCHTYELAGSVRVWEVTVSERSSNSVRFYYTKPIAMDTAHTGSPSEEGSGGKLDTLTGQSTSAPPGQSSGEDKANLKVPVRKSYPETTHAHTIEYRVKDHEELDSVYAYLTLMVYGWSPKIERPPSARKFRNHEVTPAWIDWDNTQDVSQ
jgi:hypothetical protein